MLQQLNLDRPSLGSYVAFLFDRINSDWIGSFLTALRVSEFKTQRSACDRLTQCRNADFGHSVMLSDARAIEITQAHSNPLFRILNSLSWLRRFQFVVADTLKFDGKLFAAKGNLLRGSNLHHASTTLLLPRAVATGHVVAIGGSSTVDLFPLINMASPSSGDWQAYKIYDKLTKGGMQYEIIPS